ncbi:hypothetical protein [Yoonia maritima]|uniref:hypothetical protein n=1 Tax=Yoonia maritima TaxID=1435347 RepID=UPI0013A6788F|nr:hypothetical protein [Yoonia maritima]
MADITASITRNAAIGNKSTVVMIKNATDGKNSSEVKNQITNIAEKTANAKITNGITKAMRQRIANEKGIERNISKTTLT